MASPADYLRECRQCDLLFDIDKHVPVEDEDGRVFCSESCREEYLMRQGELQMERRLL